jgi:predicted nucleotidyltransferase
MTLDIEKIKAEARRIALALERQDVLAVGLFGSLARGTYHERSDIDIFVVTERGLSLKEQDELYYAFSELIGVFHRDVTVLAYDLKGIKEVPGWHTLQMIKDAQFVLDRAGIEALFKRILQEAAEHGIVYDEEHKLFKLSRPGPVVFSLKE